VLEILGNQLQTFNSLKALEDKINELQQTTKTQLRITEDEETLQKAEMRVKLLG
jgi:hypothetical protein